MTLYGAEICWDAVTRTEGLHGCASCMRVNNNREAMAILTEREGLGGTDGLATAQLICIGWVTDTADMR